ncbi:peptidylprolyl isomerase [Methylovorus sp. MM2]|uniref:peptidylprolyl isomerase n=1 Tax=Methylovorus sp. MM2 TaxID=1848038 RepID=UPI0007E23C61|nr:peptidylprolyl isomerase [Methylovorus sp. MM2]OAM51546.1 peptidylprolyl isomerase [Methylovorus sp. MM2]
MRSIMFTILLSILCGSSAYALEPVLTGKPQVEIQTNKGSFVVELYPEKAPQTVNNFLKYVEADFYKGTIFHRVMKNFMVQGGGLTVDLKDKSTYSPIINESNNGLKNEVGTLSMARAFASDSATSQFFINLSDNKFLNFYKPDPHYIGYCVFGKVVRGLDIIQRIGTAPTQEIGLNKNVPIEPVIIEKVTLLEAPIPIEEHLLVTPPDAPKKKPSKAKPIKTDASKATSKGKTP